MAKSPKTPPQVTNYAHDDRRVMNPEVGLVKPDNDPEGGKSKWAYDPHLDPALQFDVGRAQIEALIDDALASGDQDQMRDALLELKRMQQPYLNWAGKAERTSFDIDTVSLHVHERIDPASILEGLKKKLASGGLAEEQLDFFHPAFEDKPLREALGFYKHDKDWSNRLVSGDSLLVMNSLLQKESMRGQVQMIYIDPPYGIKYGSNFQPFTNKRDVKDRSDADLTAEPEMIKAFRDTWELGIHSYLAYLRDRLVLVRELLSESGSVFVQISDENLHHVREMMDEIFGVKNFISLITVQKTTSSTNPHLSGVADYLIWYAKEKVSVKYRELFNIKEAGQDGAGHYRSARLPSGSISNVSKLSSEQLSKAKLFTASDLQSASAGRDKGEGAACWFPVEHEGKSYLPSEKSRWKTNEDGVPRLLKANRIIGQSTAIRYLRFLDDFPSYSLHNVWSDLGGASDRQYVVETNTRIIERCLRVECWARYADDLTFSSKDWLDVEFLNVVEGIVETHGFKLNRKKTKFMGPGDRMDVTGVVINQKVNFSRTWRNRVRGYLHRVRMNPEQFYRDRNKVAGLFGSLKAVDPEEQNPLTAAAREALRVLSNK